MNRERPRSRCNGARPRYELGHVGFAFPNEKKELCNGVKIQQTPEWNILLMLLLATLLTVKGRQNARRL